MMNNMGGIMQGKVAEVREDIVVMDFNHPMAGKTLNFSGKVIEVREATEQELTDGLFGEKKAHSGCGGSCSDDCCSSCGGGCH
jgi:FKBP-type peptidyl-prolyl cis-trans isomerase SlyD